MLPLGSAIQFRLSRPNPNGPFGTSDFSPWPTSLFFAIAASEGHSPSDRASRRMHLARSSSALWTDLRTFVSGTRRGTSNTAVSTSRVSNTVSSSSSGTSRSLIRQAERRYSRESAFRTRASRIRKAPESIAVTRSSSVNPTPFLLFSMAAAAITTTSAKPWYEWSWRPTSAAQLEVAEAAMLAALKTPFELSMVKLETGEHINTIKMGTGPPLVMIHGFGGGLALFAANMEILAQSYTVYAIDLPGFGRSTRPDYIGKTAGEAESYFVGAFDQWMDAVGLESAIIMGHSLGAFLSASWALSHPHRFQRLILVDPFGVPAQPLQAEYKFSIWRRMIVGTIKAISSSPLTLLRAAGPWGPGLIKSLRPDLIAKFSHLHTDPEITANYIYHVNAQSPASGEVAFTQIMAGIGYAANPLMHRLPDLDPKIPISFIYGEESWMKPFHGVELKESMPNHISDFIVIPQAGHHVYIDQWEHFNNIALLAADGRLQNVYRPSYQSILWAWKAQVEAAREAIEALKVANATTKNAEATSSH